ncbi:hypothetical protein [Sphingomonas panni]|uniref:hypothetical protein n=1 Tax=Sphingomonas panni TaxID=237612 RepID=UPI001F5B20F3|nr:hypothetical protein [Sphingomonas panni]
MSDIELQIGYNAERVGVDQTTTNKGIASLQQPNRAATARRLDIPRGPDASTDRTAIIKTRGHWEIWKRRRMRSTETMPLDTCRRTKPRHGGLMIAG